ncbi:MAG TPA: hypothetical protein VH276_11660 [Solirubrobacteraceae bacterium]|nr:hypothetical protein [Solirubrobacteraceae bacterium]
MTLLCRASACLLAVAAVLGTASTASAADWAGALATVDGLRPGHAGGTDDRVLARGGPTTVELRRVNGERPAGRAVRMRLLRFGS